MGEALKSTEGGAGGEQASPAAAEGPAAGVVRDAPATTAEVEEWYKDSGDCVSRRSTITNADGLKLACYHWDPETKPQQSVRGKVVLIHGYAVHARFEYLRHDLEQPEAPPQYARSWIQRLAAAGFSVHAMDQQSFGASEGLKGKRAHLQDFDALPRDIIQFLHEQVLPAHDPKAPIYLCGISMGGCAVTRAVELLAGGHFRTKGSETCAVHGGEGETGKASVEGEAGDMQLGKEDGDNVGKSPAAEGTRKASQQQQPQQKVLLPLKGLICLAPMFALDRLKKKNRLVLPFAKLLANLSPCLEIAKAAKNPIYPAFDTLMKNDPLAYNGKSRARLSYELLYAVSAVTQQAHYLAVPDPAALTPQSPQPFPLYINAPPALLIVESKNDTFVDPEGSVYVAAVVGAKMEASPDTLAKYKSYYDSVQASLKPKGHPDAALWMLDDLWHCFTKEVPESDALLDRIIDTWLVPHAAAARPCTAPQPVSDHAGAAPKSADEAAEGATTATPKAGSEGSQSPRTVKHQEQKDETDGAAAGASGEGGAEAFGATNDQEPKLPLTPAVSNASERKGPGAGATEQPEEKGDMQPGDQAKPDNASAAAAASGAEENKTEAPKEEAERSPAAAAGAPDTAFSEASGAAAKNEEKPVLADEHQRDSQEQQKGATEEATKQEGQQQAQTTVRASEDPTPDTAKPAEPETLTVSEQQHPQQPEGKEAECTQGGQKSEQEVSPTAAQTEANPPAASQEARPTASSQEASPTAAQQEASPTPAQQKASPTPAQQEASPTPAQQEATPTAAQQDKSGAPAPQELENAEAAQA